MEKGSKGKGRVERFEDLIAWQKARELTRSVYEITKQGDLAKDFGLRDQMRRAAVSVMSNACPVKSLSDVSDALRALPYLTG